VANEVTERIEWSRPSGLAGVEVLLAERAARRWVVFHETYTVCACLDLAGAEIEWKYRHKTHRAVTGTLMLMEPGEVHANTRITPPINFRVVLIDPSLVLRAAAELGMTSPPQWKLASTLDPVLLRSFAALHASLERPSTSLERESRFVACLRLLLEHYSETGSPSFKQPQRVALARARDLIHQHFSVPIALNELTAVSGLSQFHLVRAFATAFGVPPHAYQLRMQTARARALLAAGTPPAEVAAEAGFADQSHLTRHFKAIYGVTPGEYRRGTPKRRTYEVTTKLSLNARAAARGALNSAVPRDVEPRKQPA